MLGAIDDERGRRELFVRAAEGNVDPRAFEHRYLTGTLWRPFDAAARIGRRRDRKREIDQRRRDRPHPHRFRPGVAREHLHVHRLRKPRQSRGVGRRLRRGIRDEIDLRRASVLHRREPEPDDSRCLTTDADLEPDRPPERTGHARRRPRHRIDALAGDRERLDPRAGGIVGPAEKHAIDERGREVGPHGDRRADDRHGDREPAEPPPQFWIHRLPRHLPRAAEVGDVIDHRIS